MNYEQKYNNALERARGLLEGMDEGDYLASSEDIENIFPELKESKDERIKNFLIGFIKICTWTEKKDQGWPSREDCLTWLKKQSEKKPIDEVGPKFKVGDWVLNNVCYPLQIALIKDSKYIFTEGDALSVSFVDEHLHLWSIQDAGDGDVLVDSYSKDSLIILYKGINKEQSILAHCGWNGYNFSIKTNGLGYGGLDNTNYLPATKEQRDLLFSKMKEAGYEWDSKKKELKKIEVTSKESEDERIRKGLITAVSRIFEGHKLYDTDVTREEALVWLEKQIDKD